MNNPFKPNSRKVMPLEHRVKKINDFDDYSRNNLELLVEAFSKEDDNAFRKILARKIFEFIKVVLQNDQKKLEELYKIKYSDLMKAEKWRLPR